MKTDEKKQITDIVNAFRLINKDIRKSFNTMSNTLQNEHSFEYWKKWKTEDKNFNIKDSTNFFDGDNWYYINCYGVYNEKVIGFTFIVSINYEENDDEDYASFLKKLDENINLNTPMLCILGIYTPINLKNIKLLDENGWHYVDTILQFTGDWKNYEEDEIEYNKWLDIEIEYSEDDKTIDGYEGWYKSAKVRINHITDISSKETAEKYIKELINEVKKTD